MERWAKWTLAATIVGPPVLYVLSFGPACWLNERTSKEFILMKEPSDPGSHWDDGIGVRVFPVAYKPFLEFADGSAGWRSRLFRWYAEVGARNATLYVRGNGGFDWYRPDVPPSEVMDETGTLVDNPAVKPRASNSDTASKPD
jgi:hypothetical protein